MAKNVIIERYVFTPSTRTVQVIGKNIRREQLLLITNTTTDTVIYNFSDPSLAATSYTNSTDATTALETTTIILAFNTAAMSATDKISIMVEESYYEIKANETYRDPVDKLRVSQPQSLIDTDFEYGVQPSKWESLTNCNNRPSVFIDVNQGISNITSAPTFRGASGNYQLTNATASGTTVTLSISNTTGITVGTPIYLQGTLDEPTAGGYWLVESVSVNTNITFSTIVAPAATLWDPNKTYLYIGTFFTGAPLFAATNAITVNGTTATVTTTFAHGLRVGNRIHIVGTTGATGRLNSTWQVATTPTSNTFTFACPATGTITAVLNASIYPAIVGYSEHRPFDGGVQFTNLLPFHGTQVIRQSRRQFRYQSGKATQFSTGTILRPNLALNNMTASGTTVTVTTKNAHGLGPGATVLITGADQSQYNGTFTVLTTPTYTTFTFTALSAPTVSPATGASIAVGPANWWGSSLNIGMFDQQNGAFYQWDGQQLWCVRRNSTYQTSGTVTVTQNSTAVTGAGTKFAQELKPGNFIVIRGQSYLVQHITSDTAMTIYPEYRGASGGFCQVSLTVDTRFAQSNWNIDRCDGTGASLYNINFSRMQMLYMDYSWYGAGAVRFGFKNTRGEVIYAHRIVNNNTNTEAYFRSGNLPARYETNSFPYFTFLTATLSSGVTASMSVADTTFFASAGTLVVTAAAETGSAIEYITYTGKTATTFTGLTRNATGGTASATTFTVTGNTATLPGGTAPIKVEAYSPQASSTVVHWGSAVIMDGRFDDDKSIVFVGGMTTAISNIGAGVTQPLLSLRAGPAVDNGLVGTLGQREIINRAQVILRSLEAYSTGTNMTFLLTLVLNGRVSGGTFSNAGAGSLSQLAFHTSGQTISGGDVIFGAFTNTPGVSSDDLGLVRDLGTSILGGGLNNNVPTTDNGKYPDGPDVITLCARNVTAVTTNSINARINWTESQA
jgi:hypothetical protein